MTYRRLFVACRPGVGGRIEYHPAVVLSRAHLARLSPRTLLWLALALYAGVVSVTVVLGQPNSDEGFYQYGAWRVLQGERPYSDFAYVQMPALPYLYAPTLALFGTSVYVGRLTTAAFALAQLGAALALARRYGGLRAAALTALLLGSFSFVVYFNTIVKTYALVSLLLTLTMLTLPRAGSGPLGWAPPVACVTLAALVRLSAVAAWLPVLLYGLWSVRGGWRARLALGVWAAGLWLPALYLFTRDPAATAWQVLGLHLEQWHGASLARRLAEVVAFRLPSIVTAFAPHAVLTAATVAAFGVGRRLPRQVNRPLLMLVSLGAFAGSHLISGEWQVEYLVPAAAAAMPLLAVGLTCVWERSPNREARAAWAGLLAATVGAALLYNFPSRIVLNPAYAPLEVQRAAARVVAEHSTPSERVLALEALGVALEAQREVLPGLSVSSTSVQALPDAQAAALHVVTPDMLAVALETHAARIVLLTPGDWGFLARLGGDLPRLEAALAANYQLITTQPRFGQYSTPLAIYLCRACP